MTRTSMLRLKLVAVIRFSVIGLVVGTAIGYVNFRVIGGQPEVTIMWGVISGFMIGASVGSMEVFVFFGRMRRAPFLGLLVARVLAYAATFVVGLTAANAARVSEARGVSWGEAARFYLLEEGVFVRDFLLVTVASFVFVWILQATQLQRGRDVLNFILGRYHRPQEMERVFLFVDLTSSTTLAEKLGHLTYSAFLQDFFFDVNMAALPWRGEIYQYVGDEVIVSWPMKTGIDQARCVQCFFAMLDTVAARRDEYVERYGVYPMFRGGMHGGVVVVTWVGEIKKEIVYHGDVLNTAARIQGESKSGPFSCLVSGELLDQLDLPAGFTATPVGKVALRGKESALVLFGLEHTG